MNEIVKLKLEDIIPYERNPRKNDNAVDDVAESIRQTGYRAKIIVDENNVIIAGHTRWKALQKLGWKEAEVQRELDMTEAQKRKYRLLDNKVAEKASWDYELLDWEMEDLDFEGYDFGFDTYDDIFSDVEDLHEENYEPPEKVELVCPACGHRDSKERFRVFKTEDEDISEQS